MKLAEALNARKELEARLTRLQERLHACTRVQQGLPPCEDPEELYAKVEKASSELTDIVVRIARTNVATRIEGRLLADWIAERDVSQKQFRVMREVLRSSVVSFNHYDRPGSIRSVTTFDVAARHAELDALALRINALDARIQQANWETDLL